MIKKLTLNNLVAHLKEYIDLHWLAVTQLADQIIKYDFHINEQAILAGHLNLIHCNRIQVIGNIEWNYINKLKKNSRKDTVEQIFSRHTAAIVFSDAINIPKDFIDLANEYQTPLLSSDLPSGELIDSIRYYLSSLLA